jgi:hypothetical protein
VNWYDRVPTTAKIGVLLVVSASTIILLATRANTQEVAAEIPNCAVGSLMRVSQGTPPMVGTPEWDAMTFSTPREAAASMFDEYREAGRVDGVEIEATEVGVIDEFNYFVPNSDDPDRGEALFVVEQVGDRYAVLHLEYCEGAQPTEAIEEVDLAS